jgi:hypothetical protein
MSADPHASTFDNVRYDLQAAGEFVSVKSLDDDLEIQIRLEANSGPAKVSFVTAVAARMGGHRVMLAVRTGTPLRIDGQPVELSDGRYLLSEKRDAAIIHSGNRYTLVWPDGTNIHVDFFRKFINLYVPVAKERDGRLVGLMGDANGDEGENDFQTRDGKSLSSPPEFETRYKVFAESWRISPDESLFDYEPGESTETYTRRDVPLNDVKVDDIDPADRAHAERLCREAGVTEPQALEECTFDLALTGDEDYIASALSLQKPESFPTNQVSIDAPSEAIASFPVEVRVSGPAVAGYRVLFAPAGSGIDGKPGNPYSSVLIEGDDDVLTLLAPFQPGEYELRYLSSQGEKGILISKPFRSLAPTVRIEAAEVAQGGTPLEVRLIGDLTRVNGIQVVPVGSPVERGALRVSSKGGTEETVRIRKLPSKPGEYEIRYATGPARGRQVYARHNLTIQ